MRRLSVSEAAFVLSVSDSTVRRRIKRGELRALRELVGGRNRTWVVLDADEATGEIATTEAIATPDAVSETPAAAVATAPIPITRIPIAPTPPAREEAETEPTEHLEPLAFKHPEPAPSWLTGWALRTPRTLEWVAPSGAGEPVLTLRLAEARVHRTEQLARTYAGWLPIEVEAMPVAV